MAVHCVLFEIRS